MDIIRHDDGSLTLPVAPDRHANDDPAEGEVVSEAETITLRPGEGGYNEALASLGPPAGPVAGRPGLDRVRARGSDGGRARRGRGPAARAPKRSRRSTIRTRAPKRCATCSSAATPRCRRSRRGGRGRRWGPAPCSPGDEDHRRGAGRDRQRHLSSLLQSRARVPGCPPRSRTVPCGCRSCSPSLGTRRFGLCRRWIRSTSTTITATPC